MRKVLISIAAVLSLAIGGIIVEATPASALGSLQVATCSSGTYFGWYRAKYTVSSGNNSHSYNTGGGNFAYTPSGGSWYAYTDLYPVYAIQNSNSTGQQTAFAYYPANPTGYANCN